MRHRHNNEPLTTDGTRGLLLAVGIVVGTFLLGLLLALLVRPGSFLAGPLPPPWHRLQQPAPPR